MDLVLPPPPPGFDPSSPNYLIKPHIDLNSIKHMLVFEDPSGTTRVQVFSNEEEFEKGKYGLLFSHPDDLSAPSLIDHYTFE